MPLNRRLFLVSLGSSGVLVACGGGGGTSPLPSGGGTPTPKPSGSPTSTPTATPTASPTQTPLPAGPALYIDLTQTNLPAGTPVYAYIVGTIAGSSYWRLDASGTPHLMNASDNTIPANTFPNSNQLPSATASALAATYPTPWADYSIPLTVGAKNGITLTGISTANMPGLGTAASAFSARLYLSVGVAKLPFSPTGTPATGYTAPGMQSGTPGSLVLYDFFEFAFDSGQQINGDTSIVDEYGLPMTVNAIGAIQPGSIVPFGVSASRSTMVSTLSTLSMISGYTQPQVTATLAPAYPANTNYLRVLSPKQLVADYPGGSLDSYFTNVIGQWYINWQTTPLVTNDLSTGAYSGMVVGGVLTFKQGNLSTQAAWQAASSTGSFTIGSAGTQISSSDVIQCAGTLNPSGAAALNVAKMIGAAFNRGVMSYSLDDTTCSSSTNTFYSGGTFNQWAQVMHQNSMSGKAYGFPYDDVCTQSTDFDVKSLNSVTITLGNF